LRVSIAGNSGYLVQYVYSFPELILTGCVMTVEYLAA
jgi:hypothetical protein